MKAHLLMVPHISDASFSFRQFKQSNINSRWHYHTEIELIGIHNGVGTQFMGDNIERFQTGDIILAGSNVPHFWRYDDDHTPKEDTLYSTVIHFSGNLWGERFLEMPENKLIRNLIEKSKRGLLLTGKTRNEVAYLMEKIRLSKGTYRLNSLTGMFGGNGCWKYAGNDFALFVGI